MAFRRRHAGTRTHSHTHAAKPSAEADSASASAGAAAATSRTPIPAADADTTPLLPPSTSLTSITLNYPVRLARAPAWALTSPANKPAAGSLEETRNLASIFTDVYESMFDDQFELACALADCSGRKSLQNGEPCGSYAADLVSELVKGEIINIGFAKFQYDMPALHKKHDSAVDYSIIKKWESIAVTAAKGRLLLEALFGEAEAIQSKRRPEYREWLTKRINMVRSPGYYPPDKAVEQWCVLPATPYHLVSTPIRIAFKGDVTDLFINKVADVITEVCPAARGSVKGAGSLQEALKELQAKLNTDGIREGWIAFKLDSALGWVWYMPLEIFVHGPTATPHQGPRVLSPGSRIPG